MGSAEEREVIIKMEEANTIKLDLLIAKERGWRNVIIQLTNKGFLQKLRKKDATNS